MALQFDPGKAVTAIGALGTAAFGLVDATKQVTQVNHVGFKRIAGTVKSLTPPSTIPNGMSQRQIVATLESNWVNGTELGNQKAIAKSLIKLNLSPANAQQVAQTTGLDPAALQNVADKMAANTPLTGNEPDVLSRFDFVVTALLDETYQCADQMYRNTTRMLAMFIAILLGVFAAIAISNNQDLRGDVVIGLIVGLLATPLAPIAKDLSSALVTAIGAVQSVKKKS